MAVKQKKAPKSLTVTEQLERVEQEIRGARTDKRAIEQKLRQLEGVRDRLRAKKRGERSIVEFDPHKQAGPKNVELMREVFREGKVLSAVEATRRAGSPTGHQVWAIRALLKEGQIKETGRKDGRSVEYRWVGRRKSTRLGPGE